MPADPRPHCRAALAVCRVQASHPKTRHCGGGPGGCCEKGEGWGPAARRAARTSGASLALTCEAQASDMLAQAPVTQNYRPQLWRSTLEGPGFGEIAQDNGSQNQGRVFAANSGTPSVGRPPSPVRSRPLKK